MEMMYLLEAFKFHGVFLGVKRSRLHNIEACKSITNITDSAIFTQIQCQLILLNSPSPIMYSCGERQYMFRV